MLRPVLEPMLSKAAALPEAAAFAGGKLAAEPKWDGFRCLLFAGPGGRVELQSRSGKPLTPYFPEVARVAAGHLPAGTVLDGELVIWHGSRLSFAHLQRRFAGGARTAIDRSREHPAYLVAFDVLHIPGRGDVRRLPLRARRALLEKLLGGAPPQLALTPHTTSAELTLEWLETWAAAGVEGVMVKNLAERYTGGQRSWLKVKHRSSTEAIVGGVTGTLAAPETLLLGRYDTGGRLRYAGRTLPLSALQRRELSLILRPPAAGRQSLLVLPWPQPLPASWLGQFRQPAQPLRYQPTEPAVIAEIEVDTASDPVILGRPDRVAGARWRHQPRFLRTRSDLSVYDVPILGAIP